MLHPKAMSVQGETEDARQEEAASHLGCSTRLSPGAVLGTDTSMLRSDFML